MDAWLSGFADGEGCFIIADNGPSGLVPRFKISLRADDVAILEALHQEFGGFVSLMAAQRRARPAAQWVVGSKRDLARLARYFDEYPLRAKKKQDYEIWRRAVHAYCAWGGKAPELPILRTALNEGRQYVEEVIANGFVLQRQHRSRLGEASEPVERSAQ